MLPLDQIHLHWLSRQAGAGREPLKAVLGSYLGLRPEDVAIVQADASSKPRLAAGHAGDLQFNWSHSDDFAVIAIGRGVELGVDLEARPRSFDALALAERFFSAQEDQFLRELPVADRNWAFLRLWTGKEAVLKALGRGISQGLDRVVLSVCDSGMLRIEHLDLPELPDTPMQLQAIAVPDRGALAALAWCGDHRYIHHFREGRPVASAAL